MIISKAKKFLTAQQRTQHPFMKSILLSVLLFCLLFCSACSSKPKEKDDSANAVISESSEEFRVTLEKIETDQHRVIVEYSVESLKGEAISSMLPDIEVSMNADGRTQFQSMQDIIETVEDQSESILHCSVYFVRLTQATEFILTINALQDFANGKEYPVDITIEAPSLEPCEQIHIPDHGLYTDMTLSPLGLWIWDASIRGPELRDSMPKHDIYLKLKDGSKIGYSAAEYEEKQIAGEEVIWVADQVPYKEQTYINTLFQKKIDIHEITAIEIDGEGIEVHE